MKVTLTNNFHNTEITLRTGHDSELSKRQQRRAWHTLCGIANCQCGGPVGDRPVQTEHVDTDRVRIWRAR